MSRSAEAVRRGALLSALTAAVILGTAVPTNAAPPSPPPPGAVGPVDTMLGPVNEMTGPVESMDGSESETKEGDTVTVALTSDVLFALDKAELTAKARSRLKRVAERLKTESSGGTVKIEGHTDDQGSNAYNLKLSDRRAQAVQKELSSLLSGESIQFEAKGYGETQPRLPNTKQGKPLKKNREKNRRVEIIFKVRT